MAIGTVFSDCGKRNDRSRLKSINVVGPSIKAWALL